MNILQKSKSNALNFLGMAPQQYALILASLLLITNRFLDNPNYYFYNYILIVFGLVFFISSHFRSMAGSWLFVSLVMAASIKMQPHIMGTGRYLFLYWSLACFICLSRPNALELLKHNTRVLIGLSMMLMFFWKILSFEYFDGTYYLYKFVSDHKTASIAALLTQVPTDTFQIAINEFDQLMAESKGLYQSLAFNSVDFSKLLPLAKTLNLLMLLLNGAVAAAFLMNKLNRIPYLKHILLLSFSTAMLFLHPSQFLISVFCVLGIAQCHTSERILVIPYLLCFIAAFLTSNFVIL